MPFDPLLFFANAGNGDLFALVPHTQRPDVFVWDPRERQSHLGRSRTGRIPAMVADRTDHAVAKRQDPGHKLSSLPTNCARPLIGLCRTLWGRVTCGSRHWGYTRRSDGSNALMGLCVR